MQLLDDLIRLQQQRRRDREAERPGGLEVDDEPKAVGLLNGKIRRPCPLEDLRDQDSGTPPLVEIVRPVGQEPSCLNQLRQKIAGR